MPASARFRFIAILPDVPAEESPASLRVCGVPVLVRLLARARREGAVELWLRGPRARVDEMRERIAGDVRLIGAPLFVGEAPRDALTTVVARADVELSSAALAMLVRAEGAVFVPGAAYVVKDPGGEPPSPLFEGSAPDDVYALPVTTESEARSAKRRIFRDVGSPAASVIARRMNAPMSKALSTLLVETRLTPNQATAMHAAVGVASALWFAVGEVGALLAAGILFELASVLDGVDGEIARAKLLDSPRGAWVDTGGDIVAYVAHVAAVPFGYAAFAADRGLPWAGAVPALGAASVGVTILLVAGMALHAARASLGGSFVGIAGDLSRRAGLGTPAMGWVVELGRRATFSKIVATLCVLAWATREAVFYHALFFGTVGAVVAMALGFCLAWVRERRVAGTRPRPLTTPGAGA